MPATLKPFVLNIGDLDFIYSQITFQPLFDAAGNAILNWDGVGAIYDGSGQVIWNGAFGGGVNSSADALARWGASYTSITSLQGIRDVSGHHNNLLGVHSNWGTGSEPFVRTLTADYGIYVLARAPGGQDSFFGDKAFAIASSTPANYAVTFNGAGAPIMQNVVDYTPRMISRLVTTAGAAPLLDASGHIVNWDAAQYAADPVYRALFDGIDTATLVEGAAVIPTGGYGLLAELGHVDFQKAPGTPGSGEYFIGGENPGVAPTNGFFVLFGQFFDHGLDFIDKGSGKTIKIALAADDPLYGVIGQDGRPTTSITISRATVAGADANGDAAYINHTAPLIDQSQTYGSDFQVTTLLREWVSSDGGVTFHAGMRMFDGDSLEHAWSRTRPDGSTEVITDTLPTLNELRAHLIATHRDDLSWEDVTNLRNRDSSGHVASGSSGQSLLLDMNPRFDTARLFPANDSLGKVQAAIDVLNGTMRAGDAFGMVGGLLTLHLASDLIVPTGPAASMTVPAGDYTGANALLQWVNFSNFSITAPAGAVHNAVGEILLASTGDHYIAGDGRANENFALTTIHHVFHEEHNYQILNLLQTIATQDAKLSPATHDELHRWQIDTGHIDSATGNFLNVNGSVAWDDQKLFNAAKLIVEMEYQHAAVDQYARTITPHIKEFVGYSSGVDPTVNLEFSQTAFRFGHSTLRETIDVIDPDGGLTGQIMSYALKAAFLAPELFAKEGPAAIALGMSHQQMNEVDEFLTPALNQGLLGLPLDLAAINIARGRDLGIGPLNEVRAKLGLTTYTSWDDFSHNMIHPQSLAAFIAAYAFDGNQAVADALVGLVNGSLSDGDAGALGYTFDQALAFMLDDVASLTDLVAGQPNGASLIAGANAFNKIDTWIGGLAEAHVPGGLLGSTFDLIFVNQIENLMDGDRFYYLYRLFDQQFGEEVNNGQLKDIVERNTGAQYLNGSIFAYADNYYELGAQDSNANANSHKSEHKYAEILAANPTLGIWTDTGASISGNGGFITVNGVKYVRDFRPDLAPTVTHADGTPTSGAGSHEVLVGTNNRDYIHMGAGDDTAYGEDGNDIIFGDGGIDRLYGGNGDDVIDSGDGPDLVDGGAGDDIIFGFGSGSEVGGFDQLIGGDGNDIIWGGEGIDKLSGGAGDDYLYGEGNTDPFTRGGDGNDYLSGGSSGDNLYGDEGDDIILGDDDQDVLFGGTGDDILRPGIPSNALGIGPDEVTGGDGLVDTGFDIIDFSDRPVGPRGVIADFATQQNPALTPDQTVEFAWFQIEGVVGSRNADTLVGDNLGAGGGAGNLVGNNWLIGGSGSDVLRGNGGNDVIVGGSIRLDSLIGTYANPYTTYDSYSGASHRTTGPLGTNGLLDAAGVSLFEKHFTELLKTGAADFKDHVFGDGGSETGDIDTVVFSGAFLDYDITAINFVDAHGVAITALKIAHVRNTAAGSDGTDLIVGVERFQFSDGVKTASQLFVSPPTDIQWNGVTPDNGTAGLGDFANGLPRANAVLATLSSTDADTTTGFVYALAAGSSAGFAVSSAGVVTRTGSALAPNSSYVLNISSTDTTGATRTETFTIRSGTNSVVAGTNGANTLAAAANDSILYASGGDDILNGAAGADNLFGQAGNDTLNGGAGNDILVGGSGTDTVNGDAGNDTIRHAVGDGGGAVNGGADFDTLAITAGNGGQTLAVTLTGTVITNFDGGTVINVEAVTADLGGGTDTLVYTAPTGVTVDLATGTASGFASLANIENVTGGAGNDVLRGDSSSNTLSGGLGSDTLYAGLAGTDNLLGGAGDDFYIVDRSAGVTITESRTGGVDTVLSSVTFTLDDNLENLTLTGTAAINGAGNQLANVITGNAGVNTLNGGSGDDRFVATVGDGNDAYNGGADIDTLDLSGTTAGAVVNLAAGTASSTQIGSDTVTAIENVIGGAGADRIVASTARNVLTGGAGADTFAFETRQAAGLGANARDIITDFVAGADKIDLSQLDADTRNTGAGGIQHFVFDGAVAAELPGHVGYHYETINGVEYTVVEGNVRTGTSTTETTIDFQVALQGHLTLSTSDFIFGGP